MNSIYVAMSSRPPSVHTHSVHSHACAVYKNAFLMVLHRAKRGDKLEHWFILNVLLSVVLWMHVYNCITLYFNEILNATVVNVTCLRYLLFLKHLLIVWNAKFEGVKFSQCIYGTCIKPLLMSFLSDAVHVTGCICWENSWTQPPCMTRALFVKGF